MNVSKRKELRTKVGEREDGEIISKREVAGGTLQ